LKPAVRLHRITAMRSGALISLCWILTACGTSGADESPFRLNACVFRIQLPYSDDLFSQFLFDAASQAQFLGAEGISGSISGPAVRDPSAVMAIRQSIQEGLRARGYPDAIIGLGPITGANQPNTPSSVGLNVCDINVWDRISKTGPAQPSSAGIYDVGEVRLSIPIAYDIPSPAWIGNTGWQGFDPTLRFIWHDLSPYSLYLNGECLRHSISCADLLLHVQFVRLRTPIDIRSLPDVRSDAYSVTLRRPEFVAYCQSQEMRSADPNAGRTRCRVHYSNFQRVVAHVDLPPAASSHTADTIARLGRKLDDFRL
jgi:hypothetical protein